MSYTPKEWNCGDTIRAEDLNHIENGIEDVSGSINDIAGYISDIGSPIPVATADAMTDTDAIYLYEGSEAGYTAGNLYYYNGSAWVSGGRYGGEAPTFVIEGYRTEPGFLSTTGNVDSQNVTRKEVTSEFMSASKGDTIRVVFTDTNDPPVDLWFAIGLWDTDGNWIKRVGVTLASATKSGSYTITDDVGKIKISYRTYDGTVTCLVTTTNDSYYGGIAMGRTAEMLATATASANTLMALGKVYNPNVKSIAHRGFCSLTVKGTAPENTLPAVKLTYLNGFNACELDVRKTSDDVYVILHDASINRTARNADGTSISETVNIADITYEEALEYDFGISRGEQWAGTPIPTLAECLTMAKRLGGEIYLELKITGVDDITAIDAMVHAYGMDDAITYIGNDTAMLNAHTVNPKARLGPILNSETITASNVNVLNTIKDDNEVFIDNGTYNATAVASAKAIDFPMEAWTVDGIDKFLVADPYITGFTSNGTPYGLTMYNYIVSN